MDCLHTVPVATRVGLWGAYANGLGRHAGRDDGSASLLSSHQALLLGQAGLVQKGTSADEQRQWRIAPNINAVQQQPLSRFPIRLSAQLLRCTVPPAASHPRASAADLLPSPADVGIVAGWFVRAGLADAQGAP